MSSEALQRMATDEWYELGFMTDIFEKFAGREMLRRQIGESGQHNPLMYVLTRLFPPQRQSSPVIAA